MLDHLVSRRGRPLFVDPAGLVPMLVWDQAKADLSIRQDPHPSTSQTRVSWMEQVGEYKARVKLEEETEKGPLTIENPPKTTPRSKTRTGTHTAIKPILHLLHTQHYPIDIRIPRQRHNNSVRLSFRR